MGILLIVMVAVLAARYRRANPAVHLFFASGQEGGVYVSLAREFERQIEENLPHIHIDLLPSAGSVENASLIDRNEAQLALVQNDIRGSSRLRAVAPLHLDYLHFIARKEAGITGFRSLNGRKFTTGLEKSGSWPVVQALAAYFSLSPQTVIESRSVHDGMEALLKGETDALLLMMGFRSGAMNELLRTHDSVELVRLDDVEAAALDGFVLHYPFCQKITVPPLSYGPNPSGPIPTLAIQNVLVARDDVPPHVIKPLTEILFTRRAELIHQQPAAAQMTENFPVSSLSFPLHEGARQYFSRGEPGFIIRYAEAMAFVLSLMLAAYGLFRASRKWVSQRRKDRIDDYYVEVEGYLGRIESHPELENAEVEKIRSSLRRIRHTAVQQLASEKLMPDSSFQILQQLLEQCERLLASQENRR